MRGRIRLDRHLASCGLGTRTDAKRLIRQGRVALDGSDSAHPVRDAGALVDPESAVIVDGTRITPLPAILVYHKPIGVVTSMGDPWGRETVAAALPAPWAEHYHPVGRLDADTRGLLLFSQSGPFTQRILHPRRAVEREYIARTIPPPTPSIAERLAEGVSTAEGLFFARVVACEGDAVQLIVTEGKHRMVRRLLANAGHPVVDLMRIRFGGFHLENLSEGAWRPATPGEMEWANALLAGLDAEARA